VLRSFIARSQFRIALMINWSSGRDPTAEKVGISTRRGGHLSPPVQHFIDIEIMPLHSRVGYFSADTSLRSPQLIPIVVSPVLSRPRSIRSTDSRLMRREKRSSSALPDECRYICTDPCSTLCRDVCRRWSQRLLSEQGVIIEFGSALHCQRKHPVPRPAAMFPNQFHAPALANRIAGRN